MSPVPSIGRVFVVDDDTMYRVLAARLIKDVNDSITIEPFMHGLHAWDTLSMSISSSEELPDVIILDLNMPHMDGWEFLEAFREVHPHLPKDIHIFVVSSTVNDEDLERARQHPSVRDCFNKPLSTSTVEQLLETALQYRSAS